MTVGGLFLDYWNDHGGSGAKWLSYLRTNSSKRLIWTASLIVSSISSVPCSSTTRKNQSPYDVLLSQLGTFSYQIEAWSNDGYTNPYYQHPLPSESLNGVFMTSADEGWAVGDLGTIFHYTEGSWREVSSPVTHDLVRNLTSVYMTSPDEGWAVGTFSTIIHYVNGKWEDALANPGNI